VPDAERKQHLGRHETEALRADAFAQKLRVFAQRESLRDFERRPQAIRASGRDRVGATYHDVSRKRIVAKHEIERCVEAVGSDFPRAQGAAC